MTLDEALADARSTFADFPAEVFTLWLDDRIRKNGWPPAGIEWQGFLFGESIEYWQNLCWEERHISLNPSDLGPKSLPIAIQIIEAAQGKQNLISAYIPNTAERFMSSLKHLSEYGSLPGKILLFEDAEGYEVIDGNHRIAALLAVLPHLHASNASAPTFQALVAKPKAPNAA